MGAAGIAGKWHFAFETPAGKRESDIEIKVVDGENIDATLGTSILGRRPRPEERPRWERLLQFAREKWDQPAQGLFFLAANTELPMTFVQALLAIGYRPVPLSGGPGEKVVDIAIQRTLIELGRREADVLLVSNDGDFVEQVVPLLQRRGAFQRDYAGTTLRENLGLPKPQLH